MTLALEVGPLSASDPAVRTEVDALLERCLESVAQQTPSWWDVICASGEDTPACLECRSSGRLVAILPAFRFAGPLGAILTSVPQAGPLGGIACEPGVDRERVYRALLTGYLEHAKSLGCDLATVISNPFADDRALYEKILQPDFVLENSLRALDFQIDPWEGGAPDPTPSSLRRNLKRAHSGELEIDETQSISNVETWYEIHRERHSEIGARPLPEALVMGTLEHMVPQDRARFFFARLSSSGEMVAGGMYLRHGRVVDAFMPAMRSRFANLRPNYLLASRSIDWAHSVGARFYNWQGSPPDGGVHRFKAQWGGRDYSYCFFTCITGSAEAYLGSEISEIAAGYPWHYVLPFDRIAAGHASTDSPSSRRAAWQAKQEAEL